MAKNIKKPAKKTVKKTVKKSAKKTVKKAVKKLVKAPAKKSVKKIERKPVKKPVKSLARKTAAKVKKVSSAKQPKEKKEKQIGKISHYFDKINVAIVELSGELCAGDIIRVFGGQETDFKQPVKSMELDHKKINKAKKGQEIGIQLKEKAREGYKVFKI